MLLVDSGEQGDSLYGTEDVWHADIRDIYPVGNSEYQLAVGTQSGRGLNIMINAAPVILVSYSELTPASIYPSQMPLVYRYYTLSNPHLLSHHPQIQIHLRTLIQKSTKHKRQKFLQLLIMQLSLQITLD